MGGDSRVITDGPRPKHAQLRDALAELAITEGPDVAIPSERDLMAAHGVSRATVRKAIDGLVSDGLLQRIHGKGTFVARPRLESRLHLASFSQDMRRRGLVPSTRALGIELEQPPADIAQSLLLGSGDRAWRVERVRLADDQPIAHEHGWYPEPLLPGLIRHDLGGSLYDVFRDHYGLAIDAAEQTLWGEAADAEYAELLDAPLHTPLLVFRRVSTSAGKPLEHVVSRYRGDRYQLHMSLDTSENTSKNTSENHEHSAGPRRCRHQHLGKLDLSEGRQQ